MNRSVSKALKAVAVLACIAIVCVGLLTVCNMFFPKYVPTLDADTAAMINELCPTGETDTDKIMSDGYIVMLQDSDYGGDIEAFNKTNKQKRAEILAVYGQPKGKNAMTYIIESKSAGRDSDIVMLIAYRDGVVVGATVKKQGESYWSKLPEEVVINTIKNTQGDVDLNGLIGKTGATLSLSAIERAVNMSGAFAAEYNDAIKTALASAAGAKGVRV